MCNILDIIADVSTKHPWKVIIIFILISILFMIPASQIQIDSSIESIVSEDGNLPKDIQNYFDISEDFGEQQSVYIVVDCSKSNSNITEDFVEDIAIELEKDIYFKDISYKLGLEESESSDNLQKYAILYLSLDELSFLTDSNVSGLEIIENFSKLQAVYNQESFIVSDDQELYLITMSLNVSIDSADIRATVFDGLYDIIDDVKSKDSRYKDLDVGFTGGVVVTDYEGDKMAMGDIMISLSITFVLIIILLFLSFRSLSLPLLSLIPLMFGIIITAGLIYLLYGALSMLAAIFAVLLMGLGIDFCIHLLSRFTQEMEKYNDINKAFRKTSINTGKAIFLGALTTAVAFGVLYFSKTEGMHQMGVTLFIGLMITMICVLFILPALITIRLRKEKIKQKIQKRARFKILNYIGKFSSKYAILLIVILIILGAFFIYKTPNVELNNNIMELQPRNVPSYKQLEKIKSHSFQGYNFSEDVLFCVVDSYDELVSVEENFSKLSSVLEVESIVDYLPQNQKEKISLLKNVNNSLILSKLSTIPTNNLSATQILILNELLSANITFGQNLNEMTWDVLPEQIWKSMVSKNGEDVSFLVKILPNGDIWNDDFRKELVNDLQRVKPGIEVIGYPIMIPALIDMISGDVLNITIYATVPIILIVYFGFKKRNPVFALLAFVPVAFGISGIIGFHDILGVDLNLMSIMLIPLVVGIGIDDGIHILHRYQEEGSGSIPNVIQHTGKAVMLTTLTTVLAFSSFLIADHPGMRSFSQVPVLGLLLCFFAAIIFLPALIKLVLEKK